jgi:hypothetical protein
MNTEEMGTKGLHIINLARLGTGEYNTKPSSYVKCRGLLDELLVSQKGHTSMESSDILKAYSDSYICLGPQFRYSGAGRISSERSSQSKE